MKLIEPPEIAGKIATLIAKAQRRVIVVSPYSRASTWLKIRTALERARDRGIDIKYYVREGESESIQDVIAMGLEPIEVRNLHAKLYLSESAAIVSSMNLTWISDAVSLDFAYSTETQSEYNDIARMVREYVAPAAARPAPPAATTRAPLRRATAVGQGFCRYLAGVIRENHACGSTSWDEQQLTVKKFEHLAWKLTLCFRDYDLLVSIEPMLSWDDRGEYLNELTGSQGSQRMDLAVEIRVESKKRVIEAAFRYLGPNPILEDADASATWVLECIGALREHFEPGVVAALERIREKSPSESAESTFGHAGHCIRCGDSIRFDLLSPLCVPCFKTWVQFRNAEFPERVCHECGQEGEVCLARPRCSSCFGASGVGTF